MVGAGGRLGRGVVYCLEVTGRRSGTPGSKNGWLGKADYCYMVASACPILLSQTEMEQLLTTSTIWVRCAVHGPATAGLPPAQTFLYNTISLPRTRTQERPVTGLKRQCLEIFHR